MPNSSFLSPSSRTGSFVCDVRPTCGWSTGSKPRSSWTTPRTRWRTAITPRTVSWTNSFVRMLAVATNRAIVLIWIFGFLESKKFRFKGKQRSSILFEQKSGWVRKSCPKRNATMRVIPANSRVTKQLDDRYARTNLIVLFHIVFLMRFFTQSSFYRKRRHRWSPAARRPATGLATPST